MHYKGRVYNPEGWRTAPAACYNWRRRRADGQQSEPGYNVATLQHGRHFDGVGNYNLASTQQVA
jgi:hypothetical protein